MLILALLAIVVFAIVAGGSKKDEPIVGHICPACQSRFQGTEDYCDRCLEEINN